MSKPSHRLTRQGVSAGEDRSRVRHPRAALNLAMIRPATISLAIHWIQRGPNERQATLQGFCEFMGVKKRPSRASQPHSPHGCPDEDQRLGPERA